MRQRSRMKIPLADRPRSRRPHHETRSHTSQRKHQRLQQKHSHQLHLRTAQGLHQRKIPSPLQHTRRERRQHTHRHLQRNQKYRSIHQRVGLIHDLRLAFDKLPHRLHLHLRQSLPQPRHRSLYARSPTRHLHLNPPRPNASPLRKPSQRHVDATIFIAASLDPPHSTQRHGAPRIRKLNCMLIADKLRRPLPNESNISSCSIRPRIALPPRVQPSHGRKVRTSHNHWGTCIRRSHCIGKLRRKRIRASRLFYLSQSILTQRRRRRSSNHNICPEAAKLLMQLRVKIRIERQQRRCYTRRHCHCHQRRHTSRSAMHQRAPQHPEQTQRRHYASARKIVEGSIRRAVRIDG